MARILFCTQTAHPVGGVEAWLDGSRLSADAGEQMAQVQLSAQDESTLRAKAIGASLGIAMSGGSLSVGASVARNVAASSVQARVRDTTLSLSGALNVSARETAVLEGVAVAASVAAGFSGASVSGAGAEGSHVAANEVGSRIVGSSVTAGTGVSVTADNTASITAVTGAASMAATGAGLAASIGVSIAGNTFGRYEGQGVHRRNAAQASIDNSTISVDKGDIAVLAAARAMEQAFAADARLARPRPDLGRLRPVEPALRSIVTAPPQPGTPAAEHIVSVV